MNDTSGSLTLTLPLAAPMLPVATGFAEKSAQALGLGEMESLALTLACEEVFTHLAQDAGSGQTLWLQASGGFYYVKLKMVSSGGQLGLRAFNITTKLSADQESDLDELGLLIASRSVDRFFLEEEPGKGSGLVMVKEKAYPAPDPELKAQAAQLGDYAIAVADAEGLKIFSGLLASYYKAVHFPGAFALPGKLVDMAASGEYQMALAADRRGRIGGGIAWRAVGSKMVQCYGPYVFNQAAPENLAGDLVDFCLNAVAKTKAVSFVCRYPTPELPTQFFEEIGSLDFITADGGKRTWPCYFRQLKEDPGCRVWGQGELQAFLQKSYSDIFLLRDIAPAGDMGETRPDASVFATSFDRPQSLANIRPISDGRDAGDNLARHVKVLKAEGIRNVFFLMDVAHAWQAALAGHLEAEGFTPRLLLPYAGEADLVVFQLGGR